MFQINGDLDIMQNALNAIHISYYLPLLGPSRSCLATSWCQSPECATPTAESGWGFVVIQIANIIICQDDHQLKMINNAIIKWTNITTVKEAILILITQGAVHQVLADGPSVHWRRWRRVQGPWPGEQVEQLDNAFCKRLPSHWSRAGLH